MMKLSDDQNLMNYLQKQGLIKYPAFPVNSPDNFDASSTLDSIVPPRVPSMPTVPAINPAETTPAAIPAPAINDTAIPPIPTRPGTDWQSALGMGLAGFGDALSARAGRSGSALKNTIAAVNTGKEQELEQAQAQLQRQTKLKQDVAARNLLAKFTGKTPDEFAAMDADTIVKMEPLIGKILAAQMKPEKPAGVYTFDPAKGKTFLNGQEIKGSDVPAGAEIKNLTDKSVSIGEKEEQRAQKRLADLQNALDPSKQRQGAFGVSKQVFDRAERLESLASSLPDGNLDSRQIEELAIGLNSMLSGANTGAQEQVKALVPKTIWGDAKKLQEWITNNPTGLNQQNFVNRMLDSIRREKETAKAQINRTQFGRIAAYADLEKTHPDAFANILQGQGVDPAEYTDWKKGGFKARSAVQTPPGKIATGEVERTTKDGKTAIFDATTKKFLRYK